MARSKLSGALSGAAFLMATSAVGPRFLTQSTVFTERLLSSFGFVILLSILLDLGAQLNIWQVLAVTERRAQDLANDLLPGLGYFLSFLIVLGGLAFNIGNVAGAGLGIEALTGLPVSTGAIISTALAIGLFLAKDVGKAIDWFSKALGFVMIGLIFYVMFTSRPPIAEALFRTIVPANFDALSVVTLVGGTVGGYISFAGAHRLLDAGFKGREALPEVRKSASTGILVTSVIRYLLFLASLGVLLSGHSLDPANPSGSVFEAAAGEAGRRMFGLVIWCAAITSVVGAAYTSVSFIRGFHPLLERNHNRVTIAFILVSSLIFLLIGKPVEILVLAGTLNGFVLPVALAVVLLAVRQKRLTGGYQHPLLLTLAGWLVVIIMSVLAVQALFEL